VPEQGEGLVQVFRRDQIVLESAHFKLNGLEPGAKYLVTNLDPGEQQLFTGSATDEPPLTSGLRRWGEATDEPPLGSGP
jgi:hypothetical protein